MSPSNGDFESLWSVEKVAKFLGASRSWVYREAAAGLLPCIRIGGLLRFSPADIRDFVEAQKRQRLVNLNSYRRRK